MGLGKSFLTLGSGVDPKATEFVYIDSSLRPPLHTERPSEIKEETAPQFLFMKIHCANFKSSR